MFSRTMRATLLTMTMLLLAGGCGGGPPDENAEVFQTIDEAAVARRARQARIWQETAASMIQTDRPDLKASPGEAFTVAVEADGVRREIELSPVADSLSAENARSNEILREHVRRQLPAFDQERMAKLSLEQVRSRIRPMLINGSRLDQMRTDLTGGAPLPAKHVVADLYSVPAVRWQPGGMASPIGPDALRAWRLSVDELDRLAMDNLRAELGGELFETSGIGSTGKVGYLKQGVEAGVVLLPEFLAQVRQSWGTQDNLAVLVASEQQVRFTEAGNERLLNMMWPQWRAALERGLATKLVMLTDGGLAPLDYTPPVYIPTGSTRPSVGGPRTGTGAGSPTSKPAGRPYIVR
jgi:hypothetical protein